MVVRYSSANVGLSRFVMGPNRNIATVYHDIRANRTSSSFAHAPKPVPFLRVPGKQQLVFSRRAFSAYPQQNIRSIKQLKLSFKLLSVKLSIRNRRLFASYHQLRSQGAGQQHKQQQQQQQKRKRDKFVKFWTITSVPLVLLGILARVQHRRQQEHEQEHEHEDVRPTSWRFFCYQALPLNAISRLWGRLNNVELPVWAREPGFKFYSYLFGVNLDEVAEQDLRKFRNLSEFFYREIKAGARTVDADADVVCPSDGRVLSLGTINEKGEIEQVKGMSYSVNKFLGIRDDADYWDRKLAVASGGGGDDDDDGHRDDEHREHREFARINGISYTVDDLLGMNSDKDVHHFLRNINVQHTGDQAIPRTQPRAAYADVAREVGGSAAGAGGPTKSLFYAVIYLAPGDYHRFHSPANWVVQLRRYFTGELYSVAPYFQRTLANLFVLNERVSLLGYWRHGFFSMTPVGATNVGSIKVNFDRGLVTNSVRDAASGERFQKNTCYEATYFNSSRVLGGHPLTKGKEVGGFQLGSTVVLVFEAPSGFTFAVQNGQPVKMGQALGTV